MFSNLMKVIIFVTLYTSVTFSSEKKYYELDGRLFDFHNRTNGPKAIVSVQTNRHDSMNQNSLAVYASTEVEIISNKNIQWIELEKNKTYSICTDTLPSEGQWKVKNISYEKKGNCIFLHSGSYVKSAYVRYESNSEIFIDINILVGMNYVDLSQKKHLLGYMGPEKRKSPKDTSSHFLSFNFTESDYPDPLRHEKIEVTLAVDRFKVTECEFINVLWDSIPNQHLPKKFELQNYWISKKKRMKRGVCDTHDSAAIQISPYYALIYANERSLQDGLDPVYDFEFTKDWQAFKLFSDGRFGIKRNVFSLTNRDFPEYVIVKVKPNSTGYRLPYYDEWMALARGGHANIKYIWERQSNDSLASEYAWFGVQDPEEPLKKLDLKKPYARNWLKHSCGRWRQNSRPVGMLKPNSYGLYDISGLVCESVMLPGKSIFDNEILTCKGGFLPDSLEALNLGAHCDYKTSNDFIFRGLRLVRKIN